VKGDSQLIIKQVKGDCCFNDLQLAAYLLHACKLEKDFEVLELQHNPHVENVMADDLSTKASISAPVPDGVLERWVRQPTARAANPSKGGKTSTSKMVLPVVLATWSPPRVTCVMGNFVHPDNILPNDMASANRIAHFAKRYTLVEEDLYRCGAIGVLMRCITWEEGCNLLTKVHGGECRNHASSHMLVGKSF
jgi:hypothetical protein